MRLSIAVRARSPSNPPAGVLLLDLQRRLIEAPRRAFEFDGVFAAELDGDRLYAQLAWPLVEAVIGGSSAVLVSYGAARTGKSYALFSTASDSLGVCTRALCDLVAASAPKPGAPRTRALGVRWWLLAHGACYDLLSASAPAAPVDSAHLTTLDLCSAADVLEALARGTRALERARHADASLLHGHAILQAESVGETASCALVAVELGRRLPPPVARSPQPARREVPGHLALCGALRALAGAPAAGDLAPVVSSSVGGAGADAPARIDWRESGLTHQLRPWLEHSAHSAVLLHVDPSDRRALAAASARARAAV